MATELANSRGDSRRESGRDWCSCPDCCATRDPSKGHLRRWANEDAGRERRRVERRGVSVRTRPSKPGRQDNSHRRRCLRFCRGHRGAAPQPQAFARARNSSLQLEGLQGQERRKTKKSRAISRRGGKGTDHSLLGAGKINRSSQRMPERRANEES